MIRRLGALGALFAVCLLATAVSAADIPLGKLPAVVTPTHYTLDFAIAPKMDRFSGRTEIAVTFAAPARAIYLDGQDLHVSEASVVLPSGARIPATYKQVHESGVAELSFSREVPAGAAKLVIVYDAPFGASLAGLYKVVSRGEAYAFTQFEAIDARRAFPSFDEPGFKTPFDISVTAPGDDKVVGNTPITSTAPAYGGMTKSVFETTKPLPTYLVALAVGPLDIVDAGDIPANQYRDHPLHLRGVTTKGMGSKMRYALSLTPAVITALENEFELPFPYQKLDILAVPDFAAGAMENAGAVTFREQLLLMDDNAPLDQKRASLTVQAHELTHQWFGDLVTPAWWDDIWLNESFATWNEYKISQIVKPDQEFSRATLASGLNVMSLDELPSARQIHQPVNGPDDIDNAFDNITYSKGGAVLSMFESYVGEKEWLKGIHAYLKKYSYANATAHDFISTIADTTGHPEIVQAFDSFIDQPHIPLMKTDVQCGRGKTTASVAEATYKAIGVSLPDGSWNVPMCLEAGKNNFCKLVTPAPAKISLGASCTASVFPNAKGAGYYRFTLDEPHWAMLIKGAGKMDPADQLTLFENLYAALRAGLAPASDLFAAVHAMAPSAQWDLIGDIAEAFNSLRVKILPADELPAYRAFVRDNFAPRLQAIGLQAKPGEAPATALARERLVTLLAEEGRDPALLEALSKAAHTYMESNGKEMGGLPPDLIREALRAGAISGGAAYMDTVIDAYKKSDDEFFFNSAIYAAAGSEDRAAIDKFLALALTPQVRTGDLRYVLTYFSAEPVARAQLWQWFKANFDMLLKRVSRRGMGRVPGIMASSCTASDRSELGAFFTPKASELEGTHRTLAEAEETIDRCIAFKQAKGAEVASALKAAAKK